MFTEVNLVLLCMFCCSRCLMQVYVFIAIAK